jgi:hypothetical protein
MKISFYKSSLFLLYQKEEIKNMNYLSGNFNKVTFLYFFLFTTGFWILSLSEKSSHGHQKDRDDPGPYQQETNEILEKSDPEKVTRDRGWLTLRI